MKARKLTHEIWEDSHADLDATWHTEWGICLAGPFGDWFRRQLSPRARLLKTFEAESPAEAKDLFYRLIGKGDESVPRQWRINDGLAGLVDSESEPYPEWYFEEDEPEQQSASSHPLWDREMDEKT
jgi:hypothetical protein